MSSIVHESFVMYLIVSKSTTLYIYFKSICFRQWCYILFYYRPLLPNKEVLTFQTEYPPPPGSNIPVRPFGQGCSNLYCSERLLEFLKTTHVRFRFHNHTLVQNDDHKYYGLERVLVTGRLAPDNNICSLYSKLCM